MKLRLHRTASALAFVAALAGYNTARAQDRPSIVMKAEACLRANVDRVVAAESDLHAAAAFLVDYACAAEVAGASRYRRNVAYLAAMRSMLSAMPETLTKPGASSAPALSSDIRASIDPETGEFIIPQRAPGEARNMMEAMLPQMSMSSGQIAGDAVPTELRKLAGDLVLAARERGVGKRR